MTPREPDRFDKQAMRLLAENIMNRDVLAAALRAEAVNALDAVEAEFRGWSETTCDQRDVFDVLNDVRAALASLVAAPATETRWEGRLTVPSETIQALRYAQPVPPSEPAAPEKGRCFCGKKALSPSTALIGGASGTHTATRCDPSALDPLRAIAYAVGGAESPIAPVASAPLLPRVLAALEHHDGLACPANATFIALAAELRAYIAADPERK